MNIFNTGTTLTLTPRFSGRTPKQPALLATPAMLTPEMAALIADLRSNRPEAWIAVQQQFIPMAYGAAKFLASRTGIPQSDLFEAAEFGLNVGIASLREPTYNPALMPVEQVVRRAISQEVQALVKTKRPDISLDENWGDEGGHFNPFTPTVDAELPDLDDPVGLPPAAEGAEAVLQVEQIRESLPALSLLEEWAIKTQVGLDGTPTLSDLQLATRLNLKQPQVKALRRSARLKIRKRAAYKKLTRTQREGIKVPHRHLKAIDRIAKDRRVLAPIVESAWGIFTPHEQKILSLIILFRLTPIQTANALNTTRDAVYHMGHSLQRKLQDYFILQSTGTRPLPDSGYIEKPNAEQEQLLQKISVKFQLSGLSATHLKQLTFFERELVKALVGDGQSVVQSEEVIAANLGLSPERYQEVRTTMETRLKQLLGQGQSNFQVTHHSPTSVVEPQLSTLPVLDQALLTSRFLEGQTPRQLVKTAREAGGGVHLSSKEATAQAAAAASSLKKMVLSAAKAKEADTPPALLDDALLCEALEKEGLVGVTPPLLEAHLTEFQRDVLKRRLAGLSYPAIAKELGKHESPVKHSAKAAVQKLKTVLASEYLLPTLQEQGLGMLTESQYRQISPKIHRLLKHYFAHEYSLSRTLQSIAKDHDPEQLEALVTALEARLNIALTTLPPKQREVLEDLLDKNVSFSELARLRDSQLTLVTANVKAALQNLNKTLNPLALDVWLNQQGLTGVTEEHLKTVADYPKKLLLLYAQREYDLDETVSKLGAKLYQAQPPEIQLKQVFDRLDAALAQLSPQAQELVKAFCDGDYQPESVQRFFPDMETRLILRDKLSPALQRLEQQLGAAPIATRLQLRGFSFIDKDAFTALSKEAEQILTLYLHHKKSLAPLAERVKRVAITQAEAVALMNEEVQRGLASLTEHQGKVLKRFCENRFNAGPLAKEFDCSHNSILAAIKLAMNNIEDTLGEDGLRLQLHSQGLSNLTQQDIDELPPFDKRLLTLYFQNQFSLVPLIRRLTKELPDASPTQKLGCMMQIVRSTPERLTSELQKNALILYCESQPAYSQIAESIGIGKAYAGRIGPLLKAGMENIRKSLESV